MDPSFSVSVGHRGAQSALRSGCRPTGGRGTKLFSEASRQEAVLSSSPSGGHGERCSNLETDHCAEGTIFSGSILDFGLLLNATPRSPVSEESRPQVMGNWHFFVGFGLLQIWRLRCTSATRH